VRGTARVERFQVPRQDKTDGLCFGNDGRKGKGGFVIVRRGVVDRDKKWDGDVERR
jgi:hypothetical protein